MRRSLRTRSRKRVSERTPGGRNVLHLRREGRGAPVCSRCGRPLHGIPRSGKVRHHSGRTVSRPYAGILCGGCLRSLIQESVTLNKVQ